MLKDFIPWQEDYAACPVYNANSLRVHLCGKNVLPGKANLTVHNLCSNDPQMSGQIILSVCHRVTNRGLFAEHRSFQQHLLTVNHVAPGFLSDKHSVYIPPWRCFHGFFCEHSINDHNICVVHTHDKREQGLRVSSNSAKHLVLGVPVQSKFWGCFGIVSWLGSLQCVVFGSGWSTINRYNHT